MKKQFIVVEDSCGEVLGGLVVDGKKIRFVTENNGKGKLIKTMPFGKTTLKDAKDLFLKEKMRWYVS